MQSIIVYPKNPERMTFEARRFSALQIFPIQLEIICLLIYNQYGLVVQMTAYVCWHDNNYISNPSEKKFSYNSLFLSI